MSDNQEQEESSSSSNSSSLSSADTDIKLTANAKIKAKISKDKEEPDNIVVDTKSKRTSSWFNNKKLFRSSVKSTTKSDGEKETSESESVKKRTKRTSIKDQTDLETDVKVTKSEAKPPMNHQESSYMEIYNGRKYKTTNGWNIALEIKCREIATECATFKWLHNKNALILGGKLTNTTLAAAIISAVSGISVLADYAATNYSEQVFWISPFMKLILFILNLAVTVILIVQKTYNFVQKIDFHRIAERRHTWLFYDIQSQLQKNTKDRMYANDYFKWITHELNSIADSNDIDDDVIKDFYKTFRDTKIPGLDTMNQLQINVEDEESSSSSKNVKLTESQPNLRQSPSRSPIRNSPFASPSLTPNTSMHPEAEDIFENRKGSVGDIRQSQDGVRKPYQGMRRSSMAMDPNLAGKSAKKADENYVRHFREQRDMNVLNLGYNTNTPQFMKDDQGKRHNPDLMAYELRRMDIVAGDEL